MMVYAAVCRRISVSTLFTCVILSLFLAVVESTGSLRSCQGRNTLIGFNQNMSCCQCFKAR